jgi:hypothetical protein
MNQEKNIEELLTELFKQKLEDGTDIFAPSMVRLGNKLMITNIGIAVPLVINADTEEEE